MYSCCRGPVEYTVFPQIREREGRRERERERERERLKWEVLWQCCPLLSFSLWC